MGAQCCCGDGDLAAQFPAADTAPDLVLAPEDDSVRRGIDIVAEQVLGEIETGVGEPAGARHPVPVDQYAFAPLADHAAERPDERPELLGPVDRPLPQGFVVSQRVTRDAFRLAREPVHRTGAHSLLGGCPDRLEIVHRCCALSSIQQRRQRRFGLLHRPLIRRPGTDALQIGANVRIGRKVPRHEMPHRRQREQHDDVGRGQ